MIHRIMTRAAFLEKGLDAVQTQSNTIAANIAHADTPGYKALDVQFESMFSQALDSTSFRGPNGETDWSAVAPSITTRDDSAIRMDGNNVDVDREMTELAKSQILYEALTFAVSREIGRLNLIVNEGK